MDAERQKILDGTYPSNIMQGKQNKHIEGTHEFNQAREKLQKETPSAEPNVLLPHIKPQELINEYKGTGKIEFHPSSTEYPREIIKARQNIGKFWIPSKEKYVDTDVFTITYSKNGTHIFPTNPRNWRGL